VAAGGKTHFFKTKKSSLFVFKKTCLDLLHLVVGNIVGEGW